MWPALSLLCLAAVLASGMESAAQLPVSVELETVADATRPNVLIFLIDDMGYSDLAAFGSTNHSTPHIDALIGRGMKMTQWYVRAPT